VKHCSNWSRVAGTLAVLVPARAADPKDPEIGFDYRDLVRQQMSLVAEGKAKEAVELVARHSLSDTLGEQGKEALAKKFAALYGAGGKFVGQEVVGYKKLSSRLYRSYAVAHFENTVVVFSYLFVKTIDQGWKINKITVSDGAGALDELEKVVPFVPLGAARD
jgi:hypothetical protein